MTQSPQGEAPPRHLGNVMKSLNSFSNTLIVIVTTLLLVLSVHNLPSHGREESVEPGEPTGEDRRKSSCREGVVKMHAGFIRSGPTTNSTILARLYKGNRVARIAKRGEWYVVKLGNGRAAWAHENLFTGNDCSSFFHGTGSVNDQGPARAESRVTNGCVRATPSLKSSIIGRLNKGENVKVISAEDDWYLVELKDARLGWSHKSLFSKEDGTPVPEESILTEIEKIRFESAPGAEERVVFYLNQYHLPSLSPLGQDRLLVACDFLGVRLGKGVDPTVSAGGRIIDRITVLSQEGLLPKVRVVLELFPRDDVDYKIQPVFIEGQNIYIIILREEPG